MPRSSSPLRGLSETTTEATAKADPIVRESLAKQYRIAKDVRDAHQLAKSGSGSFVEVDRNIRNEEDRLGEWGEKDGKANYERRSMSAEPDIVPKSMRELEGDI